MCCKHLSHQSTAFAAALRQLWVPIGTSSASWLDSQDLCERGRRAFAKFTTQ